MRFGLTMLAFGVLVGSAAVPAQRTANLPGFPSLCRPTETVVYSCGFGRSIGSVCAGGGAVKYRYGSARRLALELSSRADWKNVHLGSVAGQQGGYQRHIRFTNGATHYIIFEGEDGQLADRPGRTYSGIAVVSGPQADHERATLDCKGRASIHPDFIGVVTAQAPKRLHDQFDEAENGPFDGWF